jgi:predicted short-subunit dehydrogenase-like oxidoreductase (DUF2520 family)
MVQYNISFAGAGRVANALCKEMYRTGFIIDLIVSETEKNGRSIADFCKADWSGELLFPDSTDIIIVAVPDNRLRSVLDKIVCRPDALVVHTAASFGLEIFPKNFSRKGVFYPLQTFSKQRKIIFKDLPFFLESADSHSSELLKSLTESIGGEANFVSSEQRRVLHIAAVFVSNFINHMLTAGKEIVFEAGIPFKVLEPLIRETISKAIKNGPENSQTGPAIRNDQNTIEKHLELLSFSPELKKIYKVMTSSIINYYNSKDKR